MEDFKITISAGSRVSLIELPILCDGDISDPDFLKQVEARAIEELIKALKERGQMVGIEEVKT